jgi:hypothetical protein
VILSHRVSAGNVTSGQRGLLRRNVLGLFLIFFLVTAVCMEAYAIFVLRDTIEKQADELKNISIQLQSMKTERVNLHEELSSIKKSTSNNGDDDGKTQHR